MRHKTAIFGPKTKIHKFQLSYFFAYFLFFQQQKTQISWNPYSYSVLANLKKRLFKQLT